MLSPAVTHPTCDLDLQRRLRQARIEAAMRSAGGWRGRRRRRWFRRTRPRQDFATSLRDGGDDVWHAFRF